MIDKNSRKHLGALLIIFGLTYFILGIIMLALSMVVPCESRIIVLPFLVKIILIGLIFCIPLVIVGWFIYNQEVSTNRCPKC